MASESNTISTKRHAFRATAAMHFVKQNYPEVWAAIEAEALREYPSAARTVSENERYAFVDKLVDIRRIESDKA